MRVFKTINKKNKKKTKDRIEGRDNILGQTGTEAPLY